MRLVFAVWLILAALVHAQPLRAAEKVALLIGNANYAAAGRLNNPANDMRLIGDALRRNAFDVIPVADANLAQFRAALRDFRSKAVGADVAMVYFAGHGIEANGRNWLIPVDALLQSDFDLSDEAIDLDRILEALAGSKVRMVVLDACRNNPFGRSWPSRTRAVTRGLGKVEIDDVLVIYAAAPGQVAQDGEGGNSPFARSLAVRLAQPGLPLQLLGGAVRDDVLASTAGTQRPFVSASMSGTPIYLVPGAAATPGRAELVELKSSATPGGSVDVAALIGECDRLAGPRVVFEDILPVLAIAACRKAQEAAPLDTRLPARLGRSFAAGKDYGEARRWYEQGAAGQDAVAMRGLGFLYASGYGVTQDRAQALRWYEQAAGEGDAATMTGLGYFYLTGAELERDYAKSRAWFEQAAAKGETGAMVALAGLYEEGLGVAKDYAEARKWIEQAAVKGEAGPMASLGQMYLKEGFGVTRDSSQGRKWLEQAAAKQNIFAMKRLGFAYHMGEPGFTKDHIEARKWFEPAAANGDADAMMGLAEIYGRGLGIPSDWVKARALYEQAAAKEHPEAMNMLGVLYENGVGVGKDRAQARKWYEQAAAKGNKAATAWLAKHKK